MPVGQMRTVFNLEKARNRTAIVLVLPLLSFVALLYFLDISDLIYVTSSLSIGTFLAIGIVSTLRPLFGGLRSSLAFRPIANLSLVDATKGYVLSAYGSIFLPSAVGGDLLRIEHMKNVTGTSRAESFLVAATERVLGLFSLVFLTACLFIFDVPFSLPWHWLTAVFVSGCILFLLSKFVLNSTDENALFNRTLTYIRTYANSKMLMGAFGLSVLFQIVSLSVPVMVAYDLAGLDAAFMIALITPAIALFSTLPISVGGIGLREASYVGTGALLNLDESVCLISGLALSMSVILSGVPGVFIQSDLLTANRYENE
ncbi:MAG: hypothetical protein CMB36_02610 [Euryarchaeota archaeon]|nr:hypothetical protein [Euryarchaeota archaeon]